MTRVPVKYLALVILAVFFVAGWGGGSAVSAAGGDLTVTGEVAQLGFGKVIISTGGKNIQYNTGRETRFDPPEYRPREGDKVKVTYYEKLHRDTTIQAVKLIELVKANPNFKEPSNPVVGTVKEAGRRAYQVYVPEIKSTWKFEMARGVQVTPKGWRPANDEKVRIEYNRVPSRFGGGYVYQIISIERLD